MKNKIIDVLDTFTRTFFKWNAIYWLVLLFIASLLVSINSEEVEFTKQVHSHQNEVKKPVYSMRICDTDKCRARVLRLNKCNWKIECAVKMTQKESYNYLHSELTNLKKKSLEVKKTYKKQQVFDLDKLAYAVAMQETKDCTLGNSAERNNCFWIMTWKRGFREYKRFETKEDSYKDFKRIWTTKWYIEWNWGLPTIEDAIVYSWNDRAKIWLNNVLYFYNK